MRATASTSIKMSPVAAVFFFQRASKVHNKIRAKVQRKTAFRF
jgi:hypothetical protein